MSKYKHLLLWLCLWQSLSLAFGLWIRGRLEQSLAERGSGEVASGLSALLLWDRESAAAECLSFLWINGMQCGVAWLVFCRAFRDVPLRRRLAASERRMERVRERERRDGGLPQPLGERLESAWDA